MRSRASLSACIISATAVSATCCRENLPRAAKSTTLWKSAVGSVRATLVPSSLLLLIRVRSSTIWAFNVAQNSSSYTQLWRAFIHFRLYARESHAWTSVPSQRHNRSSYHWNATIFPLVGICNHARGLHNLVVQVRLRRHGLKVTSGCCWVGLGYTNIVLPDVNGRRCDA